MLTALEQRNLKGPQEMEIGSKREIRLIWRDENQDGKYTTVLICGPGGALTTRVYNQAPSMAAAVDLVEDATKEGQL